MAAQADIVSLLVAKHDYDIGNVRVEIDVWSAEMHVLTKAGEREGIDAVPSALSAQGIGNRVWGLGA
jgi:hypothetical protein